MLLMLIKAVDIATACLIALADTALVDHDFATVTITPLSPIVVLACYLRCLHNDNNVLR